MDGFLGSCVLAAVLAFQRGSELIVDGAGPAYRKQIGVVETKVSIDLLSFQIKRQSLTPFWPRLGI